MELTEKPFEALVAEYYAHLNAGRMDELLGLFSDDATFDDPVMPKTLRGKHEIGQFFAQLGTMFSRLHIIPLHTFIGEDGGAIAWHAMGESRTSDKVDISGVNLLQTQGGRIKSVKVFFDPTSLSAA